MNIGLSKPGLSTDFVLQEVLAGPGDRQVGADILSSSKPHVFTQWFWQATL